MSLSQSQKSVLWIVIAALVMAGAALALVLILRDEPGVAGVIDAPPHATLKQQDDDPAADLPIERFLPSEVLNLDAEDAMARNLALPVSRGPNPLAPPFVAQWLGADLEEATKCLATAVYYEAAGEPMAGQRAVAQVILNRLRNPRYPKTICKVIYQGAERSTGCQFSFACDGSALRAPRAAGWAVANAVATSVLNGVTSAEAGQATHYHTLAVFPAWAPQLAKIGIIGHHVFYRPPGRATFGYEAIPKAPPEELPPAPADPAAAISDTMPRSIVPAGISAPETLVPARAGAVPSPSPSSSGAVRDGVATARPATPPAAARQADPVTPAIQPRQSMFPARRTRSPNLPLTTDH